MITFFTLPKPFAGHSVIIQKNAIKSWTLLEPRPEIVLFGEEEGIKESCEELGVKHVPQLEYNEYGTPLLNSAFNYVEQHANHDLLCYINADIILLPDFYRHIGRITFRRFLMAGHRWNIDQEELIDFSDARWHEMLLNKALEENISSSTGGSDYFIFRKGCIKNFPPFAVGRPVWDNWMIYYFRKKGFPVIDASEALHVIHQNHEYGHVKSSNGNRYWGEEAEKNIRLYGSRHNWFSLADVSHRLKKAKIEKIKLSSHLVSRKKQFRQVHPVIYYPYKFWFGIKKKVHRLILFNKY